MTETATYAGSRLAQTGFPLMNMIASDADGLKFVPSGGDWAVDAEATITHVPVESSNILWSAVEADLEMQNVGNTTPAQLLLELYGITCHGDINLLGEKVFNTIPTTPTNETVTFDLLRSACEPCLVVDPSTTDAGKIQLNLPYRTNYYKSVLLNYATYGGWKRYITVPVTGNTSATTDIPILITIPYGSDMNNDFSDIRFIDWNGNILNYGVWSKTNGSTATFAVKLATTPTSGVTNNITVWYKKSDATSLSNLSNVFLTYDQFTSTSINTGIWAVTANNGSISADGQQLIMNCPVSPKCDWWGTAATISCPLMLTSLPNGDWTATVKVQPYNPPNDSNCGITLWQDGSNAYLFSSMFASDWSVHGLDIDKFVNGTATSKVASNSVTNSPMWLQIAYKNGTYYFNYSTTGAVDSFTTLYSTNSLGITPTKIGLFAKQWGSTASIQFFDDFTIKKGISSEPTIGSLGSENIGAYGGSWSWKSILSNSLVAETTNATFNTPTMDINAPAYITTDEYNRYVPYDSPKILLNDKAILNLGYNGLDCYDALRLKIKSSCNDDYTYNVSEVRFKYEL